MDSVSCVNSSLIYIFEFFLVIEHQHRMMNFERNPRDIGCADLCIIYSLLNCKICLIVNKCNTSKASNLQS